jgi:hypothetical protein
MTYSCRECGNTSTLELCFGIGLVEPMLPPPADGGACTICKATTEPLTTSLRHYQEVRLPSKRFVRLPSRREAVLMLATGRAEGVVDQIGSAFDVTYAEPDEVEDERELPVFGLERAARKFKP